MTAARRVTVAALTFRRPHDLAELLPLLDAQRADVAAALPSTAIDVLVVDNDPAASARSIVAATPFPHVRYVVEPVPGIAHARNRALAETSSSDVLIFIDDDERPEASWLRRLLDTHDRFAATAVAGAVVSQFEGPLDPWIDAGRFFQRLRRPTGTPIGVAATNNLLLDLHTVRRLGLGFNARFAVSGGEDTLFTRSIVAGGGSMVWCDEAVVTDRVPRARMNRRWVLLRAVSSGNSAVRVDLALASSPGERWRARRRGLLAGLPRVVAGGGLWLSGALVPSMARRARGLRTIARGAGMLAGAAGWTYQEYRRPERANQDRRP